MSDQPMSSTRMTIMFGRFSGCAGHGSARIPIRINTDRTEIRFISLSLRSLWILFIFANRLAFPHPYPVIVDEKTRRAAGHRRNIYFRQPAPVVGEGFRIARVASKVRPLVRVAAVIVKLF